MGMKSELMRLVTLKSKITNLDVLESDKPAVLETSKVIWTTFTENDGELRCPY